MPFAVLLVWGARPTWTSAVCGAALVVAGEALRLWAVAHVGAHSRGRSLRAPVLVTSGPYARTQHPLYAGNLIVCAGLLVAARPFLPWFPIVFGVLFAAQYTLFARREERFLAERFGEAWQTWRAGSARGPAAPYLTRDALRVEWPTLRTVAGLGLLIAVRAWFAGR